MQEFLKTQKLEEIEKTLVFINSVSSFYSFDIELNELIINAKEKKWNEFKTDELFKKVVSKNKKKRSKDNETLIESIFILSKIINTKTTRSTIKKMMKDKNV